MHDTAWTCSLLPSHAQRDRDLERERKTERQRMIQKRRRKNKTETKTDASNLKEMGITQHRLVII